MSEQFAEFENRLRKALAPVEPPAELEARPERNQAANVDRPTAGRGAGGLTAQGDPRNWTRIARPVAAVTIGSAAAVGLVLVRTQRKRHKRRNEAAGAVDLAGRTLRDLAREAKRVADDVF
jgi:hypothetical protein